MFRRDSSPGGQRWSALWNGIIIGIGIALVTTGIGILFILLGAGLEYWQRKRLQKEDQ